MVVLIIEDDITETKNWLSQLMQQVGQEFRFVIVFVPTEGEGAFQYLDRIQNGAIRDAVFCDEHITIATCEGRPYVQNPTEAIQVMRNYDADIGIADRALQWRYHQTGVDLIVEWAKEKHIDPQNIVVFSRYGTTVDPLDGVSTFYTDSRKYPGWFNASRNYLSKVQAHSIDGQQELAAYLQERKSAIEAQRTPIEGTIGNSPAMQKVYELIRRFAPTDSTVLITGETGTGKELVATAIRNLSNRTGAWVALNCAAFPETLIEDELFGHKKGAFSGANQDRKGAFEGAQNGTIFLDEIGEMPLLMQPRLLRVLQEKKIKRIGENHERDVNVRVIAATNKDLHQEVETGTFRRDLYYRLNQISIDLPPLRKRREDIPLLAEHFLRKYSQDHHRSIRAISDEAMALLSQYDWPGNIRQLADEISKAVIVAKRDIVDVEDLSPEIQEEAGEIKDVSSDEDNIFDKAVKDQSWKTDPDVLKTLLKKVGGHQANLAKKLRTSPSTLNKAIKKLGLRDCLRQLKEESKG